jgi:hypothetical protein
MIGMIVVIVAIGLGSAIVVWACGSIVRSEQRYAAEVAAIDARDAMIQADRTRSRAMAVRRLSNEWLRLIPWAPVRRAA